ncbi:ornithine cyclodeaminase family protein [Paenibacillus sp. KQZ6P-2]|uniref:Ornithine cyclodeaminase family protein n=1 Tax=Paenibacillus mangrovi TaxID=2931978 RepID=A0A9X1WTT8_9BACL|nr:ornithine cyclodeaminase family protein [Paenibacillus mangrovi]MCJ8013468.1 ornithine cyclodeaminase family protein [Paenibacillus mangrovi]
MLFLSSNDQGRVIKMGEVIDAVSVALSEYSGQRAITPIRTALYMKKSEGTSLFMPSFVEAANSLGVKFVSVFPNNTSRGKQTIYGLMVLADTETGEPLAILEASYLTVIRTGAASGLASKLMAKENAKVLSVIGTGAQSRGIIQAIREVRPIEEIRLYNRHAHKAFELAHELKESAESEQRMLKITVASDADEAIRETDIIVTATNSMHPVFNKEAVPTGVHVNAVGSFRPNMQELPTHLIAHADKIVVESRELALEETGDFIIPEKQGLFDPASIYAELGEIVSGLKPGRERHDETTVFKSVGLAAMDVVVAKAIYDRALLAGVGTQISMT